VITTADPTAPSRRLGCPHRLCAVHQAEARVFPVRVCVRARVCVRVCVSVQVCPESPVHKSAVDPESGYGVTAVQQYNSSVTIV
jgi:hypothetical protein